MFSKSAWIPFHNLRQHSGFRMPFRLCRRDITYPKRRKFMKSLDTKAVISSANVTDDRVARPLRWYAAVVRMNCERTVEKKLKALGIATFLPTQTEVHLWSDRRKKIERIVIPMMIFVRLSPDDIGRVNCLSFVSRLLTAPGDRQPAVIPDVQMERFRFMLDNAGTEVTVEPLDIKKGDRVKVSRGPMRGLTGYASFGRGGRPRLMVVIDHLGCACVSVALADLELV